MYRFQNKGCINSTQNHTFILFLSRLILVPSFKEQQIYIPSDCIYREREKEREIMCVCSCLCVWEREVIYIHTFSLKHTFIYRFTCLYLCTYIYIWLFHSLCLSFSLYIYINMHIFNIDVCERVCVCVYNYLYDYICRNSNSSPTHIYIECTIQI